VIARPHNQLPRCYRNDVPKPDGDTTCGRTPLIAKNAKRNSTSSNKGDALKQRAPALSDLQNTIDHIVPQVRGGTDAPANWQLLCGPCNSRKHAKQPTGLQHTLFDTPQSAISVALNRGSTGYVFTDDQRANMSAAQRKRYAEESTEQRLAHRQRQSKAQIARYIAMPREQRRKSARTTPREPDKTKLSASGRVAARRAKDVKLGLIASRDIDELCERHENGESFRMLAQYFGVSHARLCKQYHGRNRKRL